MIWFIALVVVAAGLYLVYWLFKPVLQSLYQKPPTDYEWQFVDPNSNFPLLKKYVFPSLYDKPSLWLSVIVPAYNEEERIDTMLNETVQYLLERSHERNFDWEIIVVDDGSRDKTGSRVLEWVKRYSTDRIRILPLVKNQGKGGAVQQGMLHARGRYLLMADADAATRIDDLGRLEEKMMSIEKDGKGIIVGSRAHLEQKAVATRKWYRNILMYGFHILVSLLAVRGIRDTQCGFKLLSRRAAQHLFFNLHLRRWSFDVELLCIAQKLRIPMAEVAVNWTEIPGSKLNLFESSFAMARDLLIIRLSYTFRIWQIKDPFSPSVNRHFRLF